MPDALTILLPLTSMPADSAEEARVCRLNIGAHEAAKYPDGPLLNQSHIWVQTCTLLCVPDHALATRKTIRLSARGMHFKKSHTPTCLQFERLLMFLTTSFTNCCHCLPSGPFQATTMCDCTATPLRVNSPSTRKPTSLLPLGTAQPGSCKDTPPCQRKMGSQCYI